MTDIIQIKQNLQSRIKRIKKEQAKIQKDLRDLDHLESVDKYEGKDHNLKLSRPFGIRLPKITFMKLEKESRKKGVSIAWVVRYIIDRYFILKARRKS